MPRPGKCRACGCTEERDCTTGIGCAWANREKTLCTACVCVDCGAKFVTSSDYVYTNRGSFRVCRGRGKCSARRLKQELAAVSFKVKKEEIHV